MAYTGQRFRAVVQPVGQQINACQLGQQIRIVVAAAQTRFKRIGRSCKLTIHHLRVRQHEIGGSRNALRGINQTC